MRIPQRELGLGATLRSIDKLLAQETGTADRLHLTVIFLGSVPTVSDFVRISFPLLNAKSRVQCQYSLTPNPGARAGQ